MRRAFCSRVAVRSWEFHVLQVLLDMIRFYNIGVTEQSLLQVKRKWQKSKLMRLFMDGNVCEVQILYHLVESLVSATVVNSFVHVLTP